MTLPRYGPPDLSTPTLPEPLVRSGAMTAVKVIVAAVLVCAGLGGALITGAIAYIVFSGCFMGCSDANPVGGALLGLLAVGLLAGLPLLAAVLWRTARTWTAVKVWAGVVIGLPALYFGLGLGKSAIG